MIVTHVEVLVEEPSAEEALRLILPKILRGTSFQVYRYQCKDQLLNRLPQRLQGYANFLPSGWRIVVVVDRDDDDCRKLKGRLEKMAADKRLATRSRPNRGSFVVVNRLAIEELEAWYFGDWEAVRSAYPRVPDTIPAQAAYRDPDRIAGGTWEAFERVLRRAGYFRAGLQKMTAAREVAAHMVPERNDSRSFQVLRDALLEMATP
jgi:hypothetical protein